MFNIKALYTNTKNYIVNTFNAAREAVQTRLQKSIQVVRNASARICTKAKSLGKGTVVRCRKVSDQAQYCAAVVVTFTAIVFLNAKDYCQEKYQYAALGCRALYRQLASYICQIQNSIKEFAPISIAAFTFAFYETGLRLFQAMGKLSFVLGSLLVWWAAFTFIPSITTVVLATLISAALAGSIAIDLMFRNEKDSTLSVLIAGTLASVAVTYLSVVTMVCLLPHLTLLLLTVTTADFLEKNTMAYAKTLRSPQAEVTEVIDVQVAAAQAA